jgi:hypothetical protein
MKEERPTVEPGEVCLRQEVMVSEFIRRPGPNLDMELVLVGVDDWPEGAAVKVEVEVKVTEEESLHHRYRHLHLAHQPRLAAAK